jgi:hypothetical protein
LFCNQILALQLLAQLVRWVYQLEQLHSDQQAQLKVSCVTTQRPAKTKFTRVALGIVFILHIKPNTLLLLAVVAVPTMAAVVLVDTFRQPLL